MKLIKRIRNKQFILLGVFFVLFALSYTTNIFQISAPDLFHGFERQPEGLVVGRLVRSAEDGMFSYGGLNGVNYDNKKLQTEEQHSADLGAQHDLYITGKEIPDSYRAYKSQSGGQAMIFGFIHKILPCSNVKKLAVYRGLNALLVALVFVLFGGWVSRNFGFVAGFVSLALIFLSPWINMFAHNLWWVLWNFYLPFLAMLLVLEKREKCPEKVSELKILVTLFAAVFLKCFFSGFEFISTTLISALCPIVYYAIKHRLSFRTTICQLIKASVVMIVAIVAQMLLLITQIKFVDGSFMDGVNHIFYSFTKRSELGESDVQMSLVQLVKKYLQDDAFQLGFLLNNMQFYFGILILIIFAALFFIYRRSQANKALFFTTLFSLLAPLSWLIVFRQHSVEHVHMDCIIWYMPFMLYGFCSMGVCLSYLFKTKGYKAHLE